MSINVGDTRRLAVTICVGAAPTDPTTLTYTVRAPLGDPINRVYGIDSAVVRDSAGVFHVDQLVDVAGAWGYQWKSTGPAQVSGDTLIVDVAPIDEPGISPSSAWQPTTRAVAALMFGRVKGEFSTAADFSASTRPTADQVTAMIVIAMDHLEALVGFHLPARLAGSARYVATLYAALLLEPAFWSEQQRPDKSAWEQWKTLYDEALGSVAKRTGLLWAIAEVGAGDEPGPSDDDLKPAYAFPSVPCYTTPESPWGPWHQPW